MCEVDAASSPLQVVPAHFAERNVSGPAVNCFHRWTLHASTSGDEDFRLDGGLSVQGVLGRARNPQY